MSLSVCSACSNIDSSNADCGTPLWPNASAASPKADAFLPTLPLSESVSDSRIFRKDPPALISCALRTNSRRTAMRNAALRMRRCISGNIATARNSSRRLSVMTCTNVIARTADECCRPVDVRIMSSPQTAPVDRTRPSRMAMPRCRMCSWSPGMSSPGAKTRGCRRSATCTLKSGLQSFRKYTLLSQRELSASITSPCRSGDIFFISRRSIDCFCRWRD
mmetsp:Transcript_54412/g.161677  ORF Transcript_54412/g.161677 Transcript_54412/m.161677 type:complete len:220 (+) Transcript_54412:1302-1961(+)